MRKVCVLFLLIWAVRGTKTVQQGKKKSNFLVSNHRSGRNVLGVPHNQTNISSNFQDDEDENIAKFYEEMSKVETRDQFLNMFKNKLDVFDFDSENEASGEGIDMPLQTVAQRIGDDDDDENDLHLFHSIPRKKKVFQDYWKNIPRDDCILVNMTVPVVPMKKHNIDHLPSCVRLQRCNGCCMHSLLQCEPTNTTIRKFDVHTFDPFNRDYKFLMTVELEEHLSCKCRCRIKKEHCTPLQKHEGCACKCKDNEEKRKCDNSTIKYWNSKACMCQCREARECSTGFFFDEEICSCVKSQRNL
ncbi:Hypothetical predicted protein [Cloeon dipterum]|uniref:Platelet-derived growth factor (PDGF) family profile domain-containing protein n=1 Tax=Cloeon dipterum TaxID=197152 RepID=A0A8S1CX74_9INSE|nr:Hypothetical predicted protein [Cloeon dipterum]